MSHHSPTSLVPRRLLASLTAIITMAAGWLYFETLAADGLGVFDVLLLPLFLLLFVWVAFSFCMATAGFVRLLLGKRALCPAPPAGHHLPDPTVRTAILMPIYNEDPHRVFAGLRAIYESLRATPEAANFDFFILSDTTDPDLWLAEELAWARMNQSLAGASHVYYRHRPQNTGRKAGNIADFCERWGTRYRYMLVLDADSVMSGETIVEMVRRMEADPEIGILQAPPMPVNRVSLIARCQQFAARVYGPIFLEGFAWWSQTDGNYWGHKAILRIDAFTQHCGLSALPGKAPLGGEILSHDFVEAALMRRAGFKVCLAHDLQGSYEECPPTLVDYAQRDQRWCQGNMQHIRLIFSRGMHPISRLHLGMGAMSYLSSPLWLAFLILSYLAMLEAQVMRILGSRANGDLLNTPQALGLFAGTMALLLLPKLWGYLLLLRDPQVRAGCGGAAKAGASIFIETVLSVLIAPIMMAFHSTFVLLTLFGQRVQWNAQQRGENGLSLMAAVSAHWKQTVAALGAFVVVALTAPGMLLWLAPVLAGPLFAIPLCMLLSSVPVGQIMARHGLLLTPEETTVPKVLQRQRYLLATSSPREMAAAGGMFRRILADPAFLTLHCSILAATDAGRPADAQQISRTQRQLLAGGTDRIARDDRRAILSDPDALRALQLFAWTSRRREREPANS